MAGAISSGAKEVGKEKKRNVTPALTRLPLSPDNAERSQTSRREAQV